MFSLETRPLARLHRNKRQFTIVLMLAVLLFVALFINTSTSQDFCTAKGDNCPEKNTKTSINTQQDSNSKQDDSITSTGMEWFSRGVNNDDLMSQLKRYGIIKSDSVEQAMRKVDRGHFCTHRPYLDSPQYIGYGITISAPHMHAHALEILKDNLYEGATALDVGSGEIFLAVISRLAAPRVAIEQF